MAIPNTTFRSFTEKLGGTDPTQFVGNIGDLFYDPNSVTLRISDGVTPGGIIVINDVDTRAYVDTEVAAAVASLIDSAPGTLDTLNELASAINDDNNAFATLTSAIATLQADVDQNESDADAAVAAETARVDALVASDMWLFANQAAFPDAGSNHGRVVHSHADGAQFYAHGGAWIKLANDSQITALQADVDQNETDADAAIAAVQADVDQNEADADAAIAAVQADVDQNEADADAAIAAVQADVDQNEADADAAIAAVQADVDQNEADADAAIAAVQADVDQNEADADAAIAAVQADVDQNEADADAAIALLAPKDGPVFTGVPAGPTAAVGTNTGQLATTAFVAAEIAAVVDSAPGAINTLNELAAALGDDANFSTTVTNSIASVQADVNQNELDADAAIATERARIDAVETEIDTARTNIYAALGQTEGVQAMGTFSGGTLSDNTTVRALLQELETATELRATSAAPIFSGDVTLGNGAFYKAASERLGLGTTSPGGRLHAFGTGGVQAIFQRLNGSSKITIKDNPADDGMTIQTPVQTANALKFEGYGTNAGFRFVTNDNGTQTDRLLVQHSNVTSEVTLNAKAGFQLAGVDVTASAAELNHVDGVTSNIQTQLDAKLSAETITLTAFKAVVAASSDFADFQTRVAAL